MGYTECSKQIEGERNYHIFYELLAGGSPELLEELGLDRDVDFAYLQDRDADEIDSRSEESSFSVTKACLERIGLSNSVQKDIFTLIAAVLHLGNITVSEGKNDSSSISPEGEKSLQQVASLLQVDAELLKAAFCMKKLFVGGNEILQSQTVEQACDKRDALAKAIYSNLFTWLVFCLNDTIQPKGQKPFGFIGVLDIYGFEVFEYNSFEQLLINYANEALQRHFNKHIFEIEQQEYASEGIDWSYVTFTDNQPCLDLIEGRPFGKSGILMAMDDVWRMKGKEADEKFLAEIHLNFEFKHQNYIKPRMDSDQCFGIKHYAGSVIYTVEGFHGTRFSQHLIIFLHGKKKNDNNQSINLK